MRVGLVLIACCCYQVFALTSSTGSSLPRRAPNFGRASPIQAQLFPEDPADVLGLAESFNANAVPSQPQWVKAKLANGSDYWWRVSDTEVDGTEISFEPPGNAWRVGELANGQRYTWRDSVDDPDEPEIMLWTESTLVGDHPGTNIRVRP